MYIIFFTIEMLPMALQIMQDESLHTRPVSSIESVLPLLGTSRGSLGAAMNDQRLHVSLSNTPAQVE